MSRITHCLCSWKQGEWCSFCRPGGCTYPGSVRTDGGGSEAGTIDLLWSENEALRARVESQRQVIEDLRREMELACRRIVELEATANIREGTAQMLPVPRNWFTLSDEGDGA